MEDDSDQEECLDAVRVMHGVVVYDGSDQEDCLDAGLKVTAELDVVRGVGGIHKERSSTLKRKSERDDENDEPGRSRYRPSSPMCNDDALAVAVTSGSASEVAAMIVADGQKSQSSNWRRRDATR